MIEQITVPDGHDRNGAPVAVARLDLQMGDVVSLVDHTSAGKTTLINDSGLGCNQDSPGYADIHFESPGSTMRQSRRLTDFAYQEDLGIYMPEEDGNGAGLERFAYSDGDEAEDYVLGAIREASDVSDNSPELSRYARDWASYYHLAPGRANAIRVLDLPRDISVLELGSGCGAISRYLGENHRELHCVEGSPRRAVITRERCRDLDNVKVYCADFRKLELDPSYDLVLLNGVLEYAPVFFRSGDPDEATAALLRFATSALKKDGVLLIGIENKIGLKYWCGASEDHTGRLFDGIQGYPTSGSARTYTRRELTRILEAAGLSVCTFYSCFPDYKFATSILAGSDPGSDFNIHNWIEYPAECLGLSREYLIHEGLAAKVLYDAGLIHEFANSFLVVAAAETPKAFERAMHPDWLASKVSVANRDRVAHCMTRFYPQTATVEKRCIEYVSGAVRDGLPMGHAPGTERWHPGQLLSYEVARAVMSKHFRETVAALLAEYHAELLRRFGVGTADDEGFPLVRGECFDFIMGNIIRTPGGLEGIDEEWASDRTLTADYLLFRSLCHDVIGRNKPWLGQTIHDVDEFSITTIRTIYPSYSRRRHERNRSLEEMLMAEIRGELGGTAWNSSHSGTAAWLKRAIKAAARQVPADIRAKIVRGSGALHSKVASLFAG